MRDDLEAQKGGFDLYVEKIINKQIRLIDRFLAKNNIEKTVFDYNDSDEIKIPNIIDPNEY